MDLDGLEDEGMIEGEDGEMKRRKPHGGCGHKQPVIRKEGLKLFYAYRSGGGDVSSIFLLIYIEKRLFLTIINHNRIPILKANSLSLLLKHYRF